MGEQHPKSALSGCWLEKHYAVHLPFKCDSIQQIKVKTPLDDVHSVMAELKTGVLGNGSGLPSLSIHYPLLPTLPSNSVTLLVVPELWLCDCTVSTALPALWKRLHRINRKPLALKMIQQKKSKKGTA